MRWLMIGLLVSIAAMLLAAAGLARHIWLQRARLQGNPEAGLAPQPATKAVFDSIEETDQEF
jgi:hypothetical protein